MLRDFRGTPIEVGSTIVYPTRTGSALRVVEGTVIGVVQALDPYTKERLFHKGAPLVKLKVRPHRETSYGGSIHKRGGHVWLDCIHRVVVVQCNDAA